MHTVFWVFGSVIAFTVAAIAFTISKGRYRTRKMEQAAKDLGLDFQPDGSALLDKDLQGLPVFAIAALGTPGNKIVNLMRGYVDGENLSACDSIYWTGNINSRRFDYAQTVACFPLTAGRHPSFALHPAGGPVGKESRELTAATAAILAKSKEALGAADFPWNQVAGALSDRQEESIAVEPFPRFSDKYRLTGSDAPALTKLFSTTFPETLFQYRFHLLSVECSGTWLAVYCKNRQIPAKDIAGFLRDCAKLKRILFSNST